MFRDSLIISVKLLSNATSKIPQFVITIFINVNHAIVVDPNPNKHEHALANKKQFETNENNAI